MNLLSLFSGIGGIDLAARWAGIETVAFCEKDPYCQKVLKKHWPYTPIFDDIKTLTKESLKNAKITGINIVAGGYPCQPYSMAGKRRGSGDDRDLWPEMLKIVQSLRSRWVVAENVVGHVSLGLDRTLSDLENSGYTAQALVIPACAVDAPHERARVFVVAHSDIERLQGRNSKVLPECSGEWASGQSSTLFSDPDNRGGIVWRDRQFSAVERTGEAGSHNRRGAPEYEPGEQRPIKPKLGGMADGFPAGLDGYWDVEPDIPRVARDVPDRVQRLRCLGNACVPQQIYPIFETIMKIERGMEIDDNNSRAIYK
jgi:DNA (cytosine-5)-methyltransferase 1